MLAWLVGFATAAAVTPSTPGVGAGHRPGLAVVDRSGTGAPAGPRATAAPGAPVDPAALDGAVRAWAGAALEAHGTPDERMARLLEALSGRLAPGEGTRTASEVFASGRYNCLGLAHLIVPLARELGVDAWYVRVRTLAVPVDVGDAVVISGHVAAAFGSRGHPKVVDPVPTTEQELQGAEALTDAEAIALYHVNRGAEATLAGRPDDALDWFALARSLAPGLPELWVDEGIALQRLGRVDEAVEDWRRALALDPGHGPAWRNLAGALAAAGDPDGARAVLLALPGRDSRDPLTHLARGDAWAKVGEARLALRAYARARWTGAPAATVLAARGDVLLDEGRGRAAARSYRSAARRDPQLPRVRRLGRRLAAAGLADPRAG